VEEGQLDLGVVPVENSLEGALTQVILAVKLRFSNANIRSNFDKIPCFCAVLAVPASLGDCLTFTEMPPSMP
jgi:hypothetical protein